MVEISYEGRDNMTRSERGPLGTGGGVEAGVRTLRRVASRAGEAAEGWSKRGSRWRNGGVGLDVKGVCGRLLTELMGA